MKTFLLILLLAFPSLTHADTLSKFEGDQPIQSFTVTKSDQKQMIGISALIASIPFFILGSKLKYENGQGPAIAAGVVGTLTSVQLLLF